MLTHTEMNQPATLISYMIRLFLGIKKSNTLNFLVKTKMQSYTLPRPTRVRTINPTLFGLYILSLGRSTQPGHTQAQIMLVIMIKGGIHMYVKM